MPIYGQTNRISVDRDSLWNVFMRFEECKIELGSVRTEKDLMNDLLDIRMSEIAVYDSIVMHYEKNIVPDLMKKDSLNEESIRLIEKQVRTNGRKKFLTGGLVGALVIAVIALL